MNKRLFKTCLVLLILLITGCSDGGNQPISPEISGENTNPEGLVCPAVTDIYLTGYYDIYFNLETCTFEAVLNRNASFTLNIVPFLNKMTIPANGITFGSIVIHDDDPAYLGVDVEFSVHHPFPGYPQYDAYDMRGVVIGNASQILDNQNLRVSRHGSDLWMKNPDGYTRWFNPTEFTTEMIFGYCPGGFQNLAGDAHLNPYKYYGKHLGKDDNLWSWLTDGPNFEGVFESGSGRTMELEFPMPPDGIGLMFGYAVVVCWEEQGPSGPYYPVHIPEPVAASVTQTPDVWFDGVDSGGDLILDIELYGWDYQPSIVKIESSALDSVAEFDFETYASPGGEHYSTWHVEAPAAQLNTADGHEFWVIAECENFDYKNSLPEIPSADGPLAAFFRYNLIVGSEPYNIPPEIIDGVSGDEIPYSTDVTTYTVTATDPDSGPDPLTYNWVVTDDEPIPNEVYSISEPNGSIDIDWDVDIAGGVSEGDIFHIDCSVSDGADSTDADTLDVSIGIAVAYFTIDGAHMYYDGIGPDGSASDPIPTEWPIDFDASGSTGATTYDWDLDGDGTYEVEGLTDPEYTGSYPFDTFPGTYYPVLRINGSLTYISPDGLSIATGLYVRDNDLAGDPYGPGNRDDPFNYPANAIIAASNGDIIMVFGGETSQIDYQILLDDCPYWVINNGGIHLQGYQGTIEEPPNLDINLINAPMTYFSVIEINGGGVVMDGFEIDNPRRNTVWGLTPFMVNADNVTISHIYCHDFGENFRGASIITFQGTSSDYLESGTITNCLVCDGTASSYWNSSVIGLHMGYVDGRNIVNNTVDDLQTDYQAKFDGIYISQPPGPNGNNIRNNIVSRFRCYNGGFANYSRLYTGGWTPPEPFTVYYSNGWNVQGNINCTIHDGGGRFFGCIEDSTCINPGDCSTGGLDPLYESDTDHHLQEGSPCIDSGDPDSAYDDPDGTRSDMGCYGGPEGDWNFEN